MVANRFTPADLEQMLTPQAPEAPEAPQTGPDDEQDLDTVEQIKQFSWIVYGVHTGILQEMLDRVYKVGYEDGRKEGK